jgi:hypothetical protein
VSSAIDSEREALLKTLVAHNVQFVVIGGAGIQSHGRRYDTLDIDVTPGRDEANLHRLADALNELDCRLVTDPANTAAWVPLPPDYFTPRSSWPPPSGTWRRDTASSTSRSLRAASLAATENSRPARSTYLSPAPALLYSWLRSTTFTNQSVRPTDRRTGPTSSRPVKQGAISSVPVLGHLAPTLMSNHGFEELFVESAGRRSLRHWPIWQTKRTTAVS